MKLTKTIPYEHQKQAIEASKDKVNFAYMAEQGTGKSLMLIADITRLWDEKKINLAVIVAPKGCYLNWVKNELPAHMREDVAYITEYWVAPSNQGKHKMSKLLFFQREPMERILKILLVNVEALAFKTTYDYLSDTLKNHSALLAVDESTYIRTASSQRCLYARRLGGLAKYRRILTGTPIANRPLDLFGQCAFLDAKLLGYPTFQAFKHYYADIGYFRGGKRLDPSRDNIRGPGIFPQIVGYRRLNELTDDLSGFSFRVLKQDCLDLPDKVYETRYVELTANQRKLYNSMRDEMLAVHDGGGFATAQIALTKLMRLQTILCGHLKADDGETLLIESNRVKEWKEIADEVDSKIITFCQYREDIKLLIADLPPGSYAEYHGGVSTEEREKGLQRWRTDSVCKYFFATISTGGTGLTLNESSTVIYYSQSYDLEKRQQSEDRCHRIGQTNKVTYYDLVVENSVDERILDTHKKKKNLADEVLLDLKSFLPGL